MIVGWIHAQQNIWFVSNHGNDSLFPNCHTAQQPCATFSVILQYLQQQQLSPPSNTTIFAAPGTYDLFYKTGLTVPFSIRGTNSSQKSILTIRSSIQFSGPSLFFENINFISTCTIPDCSSQLVTFTSIPFISFINCEWMSWKTNPWTFSFLNKVSISNAVISFSIQPLYFASVTNVFIDHLFAYSNLQQLITVTNVTQLRLVNSNFSSNYGSILIANRVTQLQLDSISFTFNTANPSLPVLLYLESVPQIVFSKIQFDSNSLYGNVVQYVITNETVFLSKNISILWDQIRSKHHRKWDCKNLFTFTSLEPLPIWSTFHLQLQHSNFEEEFDGPVSCDLFTVVLRNGFEKINIVETQNQFINQNSFTFDMVCAEEQNEVLIQSIQSNYSVSAPPWIIAEHCFTCTHCEAKMDASHSNYVPFFKVIPRVDSYVIFNTASITPLLWVSFFYAGCVVTYLFLAIFDPMFRPNVVFGILYQIIFYIRIVTPLLLQLFEGLFMSAPNISSLVMMPFVFVVNDALNIAIIIGTQGLMICKARMKKETIQWESIFAHGASIIVQMISFVLFISTVFLSHHYITTKESMELSLISYILYLCFCMVSYVVHMFIFCIDCRDYYAKKRRQLDIMKLKLLNFVEEGSQLTSSKKSNYQSIQNFEIPFDQIVDLEQIGMGASGIVFRATWKNETVALKLFKPTSQQQQGSSTGNSEFEHEIQMLTSLSHPNIVNLYGYVNQAPRIGLVLEFCKFGTLHTWISTKEELPWIEKLKWILQIAKGMRFLHNRQIIHRDLKAENILISEQGLKIADFGFAKLQQEHQQQMTQRIGTCFFIAPEVINSTTYDQRCDVFSFAIICYQVFYWTVDPYHSSGMKIGIELLVAKDANFRPKIHEQQMIEACKIDPQATALFELMKTCWKHNPEERPTFAEICQEMEDHLDCWMQLQQRTSLKL